MEHQLKVERRGRMRHTIALPLDFDGVAGTTLNVSPGGVLFESPIATEIGAAIDFRLAAAEETNGVLPLHCRGRVVRTDRTDTGLQVAATIDWIEHEC